jgi:hypothetical protein
MRLLPILALLALVINADAESSRRQTTVSIQGQSFLINGRLTYAGRQFNGMKIEGLLMNSRMVQGIFDDLNPETRSRWKYPDGSWDPERNTREFIAAMPVWRERGLLSFTINLQGGSPEGYSKSQPWHNSAFESDGRLRPAYMARLERILDRADELGMVPILGLFYFGQDERLADEAAVMRAVDNAVNWVLERGYRNVLIEVNNECNVRAYDHAILRPDRVHELIERVKSRQRDDRRLLVSTSYGEGAVPRENVLRSADFLLMHGNGVREPDRIRRMVDDCRAMPAYRGQPILFNEDDHFDFEKPNNNMLAAISRYASWGYFDFRKKGEGYDDGYQSVPVNWGISSPRKRGFFGLLAEVTGAAPARLKVSDNKRFLVHEDSRPFFYLGDTAWELFHCLTREEADLYLRTRAEQKFTVIQAVVLAEFDGLRMPNAYGHLPLRNDDPTQPVEEYFQHVDWITKRANDLGLWVGMLPTWGDKWNKRWGKGPEIFTPQNARAYCEWLARRYRDAKIIWILGGDRAIESDDQREIIRAMAAGLRAGDGGAHLITLHPSGGRHSADMVHDEPWLDFNMIQSGHAEKNIASYDKIGRDYARTPAKPCMDAEPCYENHPVRRKKEQGWFDEWDVRKLCYWALFAGAHGHTYGCHDIWSFYDPAKNRRFVDQRTAWQKAIHLPGANQMRHARALMESRPFLTRAPDQSLVIGDNDIRATRDTNGSCEMVYSPSGKPFKVRTDKISGAKVKASWFNPRDGKTTAIGEFPNTGEREFTPPTSGEGQDWVLVVDAR